MKSRAKRFEFSLGNGLFVHLQVVHVRLISDLLQCRHDSFDITAKKFKSNTSRADSVSESKRYEGIRGKEHGEVEIEVGRLDELGLGCALLLGGGLGGGHGLRGFGAFRVWEVEIGGFQIWVSEDERNWFEG